MDHSSRDLLTVSLMNIGDKELNDVVCAAYRMGCDQTSRVYQKRIEKLEAALREIAANACCDSCREAALVARKALEGKDE
jgi:hypothetical protein